MAEPAVHSNTDSNNDTNHVEGEPSVLAWQWLEQGRTAEKNPTPDIAAKRPIPVGAEGSETVVEVEPKEENRLWIKKAEQRRLRKVRQTGEEPAPEYVPQFSLPRPKDGAPVFEQAEEALEGHPVLVRGPDARRREISLMITGSILTALLGTSAAAIMMRCAEPDANSTAAQAVRAGAAEMAEIQTRASKVPDAAGVLRAFLHAETPEEKVEFVRGGVAMLPALRSYYARHEDEPAGFKPAVNTGFAEHEGREFYFIRGVAGGGRPMETLVESTPNGLKLDWRFLTGAGDMEWDEWIQKHPAEKITMRAEAVLDDYYAGPFAEAKEWLCVKLTDAARTSTVWAYTPRSGPEGVTLSRQLRDRKGSARLTGTFSFPDPVPPGHRSAPQARLWNVATQGWLDQSPTANGFSSPPSLPTVTTDNPQ